MIDPGCFRVGRSLEHPVNDSAQPLNLLEQCTKTVAELTHRLRHSSDGPTGEAPLPSSLTRLTVAARLIMESENRSLTDLLSPLAGNILDLTSTLKDCPGRDLSFLEGPLNELALVLENFFAELDSGLPLAGLVDHPRWLAVISWLETAGTPIEVMDELDECVRKWEHAWCDGELAISQENELRRRWQTFRDYGDAMFGPPRQMDDLETAVSGDQEKEVVLLLGGHLQREQLARKLRDIGHRVSVAQSPADLPPLLGKVGADLAVICDNVEPSNHLNWLVQWRRSHQRNDLRLVMVAPGTGRRADRLRRAGHLGADGVWFEPFNTDPLAG